MPVVIEFVPVLKAFKWPRDSRRPAHHDGWDVGTLISRVLKHGAATTPAPPEHLFRTMFAEAAGRDPEAIREALVFRDWLLEKGIPPGAIAAMVNTFLPREKWLNRGAFAHVLTEPEAVDRVEILIAGTYTHGNFAEMWRLCRWLLHDCPLIELEEVSWTEHPENR